MKLLQLVFAKSELFVELFTIVQPRLTKINKHLDLSLKRGDTKVIIETYPKLALDALYHILPKDRLIWPYRFDEFFDLIIESDAALENDPKLVELKRDWDAR